LPQWKRPVGWIPDKTRVGAGGRLRQAIAGDLFSLGLGHQVLLLLLFGGPLEQRQVVQPQDIPRKLPKGDPIGDALEGALTGSIAPSGGGGTRSPRQPLPPREATSPKFPATPRETPSR
jgi:hypothetical protein